MKRTVQREDSNAVRKFKISAASEKGEGGSQMSNFLTNAFRDSYSRVNHVDSCKGLVDVEWNSLDWNMKSSRL